jgi:hypothetical protein
MTNHFLNEMEDLALANLQAINELKAISHSQFNWRPKSSDWSIGQIVDHIIKTDHSFFAGIRKTLERGAETKSETAYKSSLIKKLKIKSWGPNYQLKKTCPDFLCPDSSFIPSSIFEDFDVHQVKLIGFLRKADGLDLKRLKAKNLVPLWSDLNLGDLFHILLNHQARHIKQAQGVLLLKDYPKKKL